MQPTIIWTLRFGKVTEAYKADARKFLTEKVFTDDLNRDAFFFVDQIRRKEGARRGRRMPFHDRLSLFLADPKMQPMFGGIKAFVDFLRPMLVQAGKIPAFVKYLHTLRHPFSKNPYKPTPEIAAMSREEAKDRMDSLRAVIIEMARARHPKEHIPDEA